MTDSETTAGELVAGVPVNAVALFTNDKKYSEFYSRVKAETLHSGELIDVETAKGRDDIKARAFRVTKAKTTLDKLALGLTEEWRSKTALVNASRKKMVTELDELAAEVRQPVTDWETGEKTRVALADLMILRFHDGATVRIDETAADVKARGLEIWNAVLDPAIFGDRLDEAQAAKDSVVASLRASFQRLTQEEADRAELSALRAEREAREAKEAEYAAARVEADRAAVEAAAAEKRKAEAEAERAAAIQKAKDDAAAEAIAAERKASDEKAAEAARVAGEAIAAEKKRADDLARDKQEQATKQAAAEAQAAATAADDAARAKNRAHVATVQTAVKEAIMRCGVDEPVAKLIVLAIKAGEIPNVKMEY